MVETAKWIIIVFGIYLVAAGVLMLISASKAKEIIQKAGSTNFINYAEISLRMLPAAALIYYAGFSRYPQAFYLFGWLMLSTSLILFFVPRKLHHQYTLWSSNLIKPAMFLVIGPVSIWAGAMFIYGVM